MLILCKISNFKHSSENIVIVLKIFCTGSEFSPFFQSSKLEKAYGLNMHVNMSSEVILKENQLLAMDDSPILAGMTIGV